MTIIYSIAILNHGNEEERISSHQMGLDIKELLIKSMKNHLYHVWGDGDEQCKYYKKYKLVCQQAIETIIKNYSNQSKFEIDSDDGAFFEVLIESIEV